ncbi:MAG: phospho-N-acetylmuramoyl-pentapeptide-transferase [Patescibacteria group bacterium]|nr:phospho-N-acetylmuramoyl-pentapeptide-transferase [Patescibacteria group bacterium]
MELLAIIKIIFLTIVAFLLAIAWLPFLINFLYKYKLGKKIRNNGQTPIYTQLHQKKAGTPTMGGLIIWLTTLFLILIIFFLWQTTGHEIFKILNFLVRKETFLPLGVLVASAIVGLIDDLIDVRKGELGKGGLRMRHRLILYTLIAAIGAWWFFDKLEWTTIHLPFLGNFEIGWWYIPLFIFVIVATSFSVNETDGLDGLAGGLLLIAFLSYGLIAFLQEKTNLATFCGVIIGGLIAFLWHNIYPARFFMGDTGAMGLGVTLGVIAMLTNTVILLPIICFPFVLESLSVIIQVISKKIFHRKVFLSTPLHHHLEARGLPEPKIVMRFWLIGGICAAFGLMIFLIERLLV